MQAVAAESPQASEMEEMLDWAKHLPQHALPHEGVADALDEVVDQTSEILLLVDVLVVMGDTGDNGLLVLFQYQEDVEGVVVDVLVLVLITLTVLVGMLLLVTWLAGHVHG